MSGIKLTWDIGLFDPEKHYIYRSASPISPNNLPTPIAEVGQGISEYTDLSIIDGETYHYFVAAEKMGLLCFADRSIKVITDKMIYIDNLDISTLSSEGVYTLPIVSAYDVQFYNNGLGVVYASYSSSRIYDMTLSTAYVPSSPTSTRSFAATHATSLSFSDDGLLFNWVNWSSTLVTWELSSPFDLSTVTNTSSFSLSNINGGISFADNGKYLITTNRSSSIYIYENSTPFMPSTASLIKTITLEGRLYGLVVSYDGLSLYAVQRNTTMFQFAMTSPFNFDSLHKIHTKTIGISAYGVTLQGGKMFVVDDRGNRIETFT